MSVSTGKSGLTIALPRGALFAPTLDMLDSLHLDTAELRGNDRRLLFDDIGTLPADAVGRSAPAAPPGARLDQLGAPTTSPQAPTTAIGVITMRPSDVPTYVEAGAADLGITGKDVLLEQVGIEGRDGGRDVYELLDLGFGACTMVLATAAQENASGEHPAQEALRRFGVMRIATKYPRIALRHMEQTGRQAEIVEVKGSVELAPLTGLAEAIVDLTATGTTLAENGLIAREEIVHCTARLIANPVAHKLKAAAIYELLGLLGRADR